MMKQNYLFTILLLCSSALIFSCSKLEEKPYSFFTPNQFYNTATDAEAGLTAVYGPLGGMGGLYGREGWQVPDYSADQMYPRAVVGRDALTTFNYDATLSFLLVYWRNCYTGINNANVLLANIGKVNMDATRKKQIEAEAKFMRSLYYFHLVKNWGDVPLRKDPINEIDQTDVEKSPRKEVYAFIIEDLKSAEMDLPVATTVRGRPKSMTASALLSKVYLYNEDYTNAAAYSKKVMDSNVFGLMPDVINLWKPNNEDANRREMIFAVEYTRTQNTNPGNDLPSFNAPAGSGTQFSVIIYGSQFAFRDFYRSFHDNDKRKKLMDTTFINPQGVRIGQGLPGSALYDRAFIRKFEDPQATGANQAENNFPIIRYADVLLIYAEALARTTGVTPAALDAVNQVRRRAFGVTNDTYDLSSALTAPQFIEAILQERSYELCFEADRWYDLTRTGKYLQVASALNSYYLTRAVLPRHRWFPIPTQEVQSNTLMVQTDGW